MSLRELGRRLRELTGGGRSAKPLPTQPRRSQTWREDNYAEPQTPREYARYGIDWNNPNPDGSDYRIMNAIDDDMTGRRRDFDQQRGNRDHLTNAEAVYLQGVNKLRADLQESRDTEAITKAENAALSARVDVLTDMLTNKTADCDRWQTLATELVCHLNTAGGIINEVLSKAHAEAKKLGPSRTATVENIDREIERRRDQPPSAVPAVALDGQSEPDDGRPPPAFLTEDKHG